MAISFGSSPGNLFNCWGSLGQLVKEVRTHQLAQQTNMADPTLGVVGQLTAEPDIQALMGDSYLGLLGGVEGACNAAASIAASIANRKVFRDNPQINQTLTQTNTIASLVEIIRQMKIAGATVLAATVSATPGAFSGTGNGIVNVSTRRPLDGLVLENAFAETLTLTVATDSYSGSATAGNESISVTGQGSQSDVFAFNWPLGSNVSATINAINGNSDVSAGNLLTNSGFEAWTSNDPDNWSIDVGTAGTNILEENTIVYDGVASLALVGAGGAFTTWSQQFDSTAGTSGTLSPQTQYSFNVWGRRDGVAAAAGVLRIALVDENGVVVQGENGYANSFTIDLTTLTTSFASFTGIFRTPAIMPDEVHLQFYLSTPLTNGRTVYFDKASMGIMTQLYTHGPFLACHAGSTPFEIGDRETTVVTNSRGAAGTLSTFQTLFYQCFPEAQANELLLPSSSTPSISDALIA